MAVQRFGNQLWHDDWRQVRQRRQGGTEVMRRQTELAGVRRQPALIVRRVPDGMRPCRQLGKEENGNEQEVAQRIHEMILVDLDEQALEIFAFREIQGHRMIGRPGQATHDARLAPGIVRGAGDDLLEQFQPDAAGTGVGHQQAAWLEQAEAEQVDVLVGARCALGMGGRRRELGRIEDDQVEQPAILAEIAQRLKDIGLPPLGPLRPASAD